MGTYICLEYFGCRLRVPKKACTSGWDWDLGAGIQRMPVASPEAFQLTAEFWGILERILGFRA